MVKKQCFHIPILAFSEILISPPIYFAVCSDAGRYGCRGRRTANALASYRIGEEQENPLVSAIRRINVIIIFLLSRVTEVNIITLHQRSELAHRHTPREFRILGCEYWCSCWYIYFDVGKRIKGRAWRMVIIYAFHDVDVVRNRRFRV